METVASASAVPPIDGVVSLVGVVTVKVGALGTTVSTTSENVALDAPMFPAASVAAALNEYDPSDKALDGVNV